MNQELPVYKYSPLKVIHFNLDKNKIETYLNPRDRLMMLKSTLIPKHFIYDMLDDSNECRVDIRFTFRVSDEKKKLALEVIFLNNFFY